MEASSTPEPVLRAGDLEVRPDEGLALAAGRTLMLSVREFGLLVALTARAGHIVGRDDLFAEVWGGSLRHGDRSVDVYVHKLRVKLESAVPHVRWIHTHVGFGYRLEPEPAAPPVTGASHPFHTEGTPR
ncbi:helix-turn-helix domain-containing protein [Paraconexibacter sp.]|uniref:winged helix-turn-helix domain-containing protein n=1 Tax=Paraconexibacter sp. TaxID=2949640 RepID=UPI00356216A7